MEERRHGCGRVGEELGVRVQRLSEDGEASSPSIQEIAWARNGMEGEGSGNGRV